MLAEQHELQQALALQPLALVVLLRQEVVSDGLLLRRLLLRCLLRRQRVPLRRVRLSGLLLPRLRLLPSLLWLLPLAMSGVLRRHSRRRPSLTGLLRCLWLWLSLLGLALLGLLGLTLSLLVGSRSLGLSLRVLSLLGLDGGHLRLLYGQLVRCELTGVVGILAGGQGTIRHLLLDGDLLREQSLPTQLSAPCRDMGRAGTPARRCRSRCETYRLLRGLRKWLSGSQHALRFFDDGRRGSHLAHCGSPLPHGRELLGVHVHHGTAHLHTGIHGVLVHQHLSRLLLLLKLLVSLLLLKLGLKRGVVCDCSFSVSTKDEPRRGGAWEGQRRQRSPYRPSG